VYAKCIIFRLSSPAGGQGLSMLVSMLVLETRSSFFNLPAGEQGFRLRDSSFDTSFDNVKQDSK
jgi:hypothetical protein